MTASVCYKPAHNFYIEQNLNLIMVIVDENFCLSPNVYGFNGLPAFKIIGVKTTLFKKGSDTLFDIFSKAFEESLYVQKKFEK